MVLVPKVLQDFDHEKRRLRHQPVRSVVVVADALRREAKQQNTPGL